METYLQELGIDRPEKWVDDASDEVIEFFKRKADVLGEMSAQYLVEYCPDVFKIFSVFPTVPQGVIQLEKLLYHVGYLKGLVDGENKSSIQHLSKTFGEE